MKQKFFFFSILMLLFASLAKTQSNEVVSYKSYYQKGARMAGGSFAMFSEVLTGSRTIVDVGGPFHQVGLNISPQYGVFVARNWMVGGYGILGYTSENDGYFSASSNAFGWGFSYNSKNATERYFDAGAAAFTRYYAPLSKSNVVSLFFHGAVPIIYSSAKLKTNIPSTGYSNSSSQRLRANFELGVGAASNGRIGSFEMMLGLRGLSIGFYRSLSPRKK